MFETIKNRFRLAKSSIGRQVASKKEKSSLLKKRSKGYEFVRYLIRFAFGLSHARITVVGRKNIPVDAPVIFAPNHQTALMDPLALVFTNKLQTVWLARADIFKSRLSRPILKFLKIWPVYRIRDGKENLSNNEDIFAKVIALLENKESVALFPEAAHSGKRQMLPHKKAIPRIALEAEEKNGFQLGLQIVPVGISYSDYHAFNRSLLVQYGEPIAIDEFWVDYEVNPQKAMLDLRDKIHDRLETLVIDIKSHDYYADYEAIRELAAKAYAKRKNFAKKKALQLFYAEKELMEKLWQLEQQSPSEFKMLIREVHQYQTDRNAQKLTGKQLENAQKAHWVKTSLILLFAVVSLPVFAVGMAVNAVPYYIPRIFVKRKVKDKVFTSSYNFVLGLIVFPVFYLLVYFAAFHPRLSTPIALIALAGLPFLGKVTFWLLELYKNVFWQVVFLIGTKNYKKKTEMALESRWKLVELVLDKVNF